MNKKFFIAFLTCVASLCAVAGLAACNSHEHSYSAEVISPTCTEGGYTRHTCECGDSYTDEETQQLGHDYIVSWEWNGLTEATAKFTCSRNAEHCQTLTANVTNEVTTAPTCTVEGERTYTAKVDFNGREYTDRMYEPISPSHTMKNNVCSICGYRDGSEGLYMLLNNETTTYSVAGIGSCTDSEIIIPVTYNNKPVTTIEMGAFQNCSITSVTIGENITQIPADAFDNCPYLAELTFSKNTTSFHLQSFTSCAKLTKINYNGNISEWCGIAGLKYLLSYSNELEKQLYINGTRVEGEIVIPSDVTTIASNAFTYISGITSIKIESGVRLGNGSLSFCTDLESVTLDKDIDSLGSRSVQGCEKLKNIYYGGTVEDWNNVTKSDNWNTGISELTIICTDGKLDKDGNPIV
ncbi:MAG: leucine-rich repeat domain-containing protein [Candidatus Coproplasma sp.]